MKAYFKMFKNYINFSGYTSRSDFWQAVIVNMVAYGVLRVISIIAGNTDGIFNVILGGYSLLTALPVLAMIVRRLRDAGKGIANLLWGLVPIIGPIVLLVKLAQPCAVSEESWGN